MGDEMCKPDSAKMARKPLSKLARTMNTMMMISIAPLLPSRAYATAGGVSPALDSLVVIGRSSATPARPENQVEQLCFYGGPFKAIQNIYCMLKPCIGSVILPGAAAHMEKQIMGWVPRWLHSACITHRGRWPA